MSRTLKMVTFDGLPFIVLLLQGISIANGNYPPQFSDLTVKSYGSPGQNITVTAKAFGVEDFQILRHHRISVSGKRKLVKVNVSLPSRVVDLGSYLKKIQLYFYNVSKKDFGTYIIDIKNNYGNASEKFFIKRTPTKPHLLKRIFYYFESVGNPVKIDCSVTGARPINITWRKDNAVLENNKLGITFKNDRQILYIEELLPKHKGKYECIVANKYGSVNQTVPLYHQEVSKEPYLQRFVNKDWVVMEAAVGENITIKATVKVAIDSYYKLFYHQVTHVGLNKTKVDLILMDVPKMFPIINDMSNTNVQHRMLYFYLYNISEKHFGNYTMVAENSKEKDVKYFTIKLMAENIPNQVAGTSHKVLVPLGIVGGILLLGFLSTFIFVRVKRQSQTPVNV